MNGEEVFPETDGLPEAGDLADEQFARALFRLHEDKSHYPRFSRLQAVHAMTGSFAPGELIFVAGGTGNGKSLFCQNLFDDLIEQNVPSLYIGTEQTVDRLKIKHACIRCGVSSRMMLKPETVDIGTTAYRLAQDAVHEQLRWLNSPEIRELAFYARTDFVNREELTRWIGGGVKKYGIECAIVDHIDQMAHGDGSAPIHELTTTVQHMGTLAKQNELPIIAASQIKRPSDPFKRHAPPDDSDLAGASGKERNMAIGIGLWRPLRTDLPITELRELMRAAKQGTTGQDRIYQENTMGVRLLKDREGNVPGSQTMLHVGKGGRLTDDLATVHGIRTGGYAT